MSDKNVKELRKQLKNVVQELLPVILTQELVSTVYKALSTESRAQLTAIEEQVKKTLEEINNRSKDVQNYVVRQASPKADT